MDALTSIVGVFLFRYIGFLQVPGTLNGDSSTFFASLRVLAGNRFVWWRDALIIKDN